MDSKAVRLFVDNLELFTKCKDQVERARIEHLISFIYICSLRNFGEEKALQVLAAIQLSAERHSEMRRESGESYIIHPLEVAYYFMSLGLYDFELTIAAIFHDVVEDQLNKAAREKVRKEILADFTDSILELVESVTKKLHAKKAGPTYKEKHFRELIESEDWRRKVLKIGDRNNNIETLSSMPPEKQKSKLEETHEYFHDLCYSLIEVLSVEIIDEKQKTLLIIAKRIVGDFKETLNNYKLK